MTKNSVFQLIDFDRTLFDTTMLIEHVLEALAKDQPAVSAELEEKGRQAYQEEQTFLMFRYLREEYGDEWLESLVEDIVSKHGAETYMLPGARERLQAADELTSYRPSWGILTFGDVVDQKMKIHLAGLSGAPAYIVDRSDKGKLIQSWKTDSGEYELPDEFGGGIVDTLTFEDDKLTVFEDTPEELIGVWVTNHEDANRRLSESGLANVHTVTSLHESLDYLRRQLDR